MLEDVIFCFAVDAIDGGTHRYKEDETELAFQLESPLDDKGIQKIYECEAEGEKHHHEGIDKEKQKTQQEKEFQKELRMIMETEKVSHTDMWQLTLRCTLIHCQTVFLCSVM